jgi:arabinofuranosyltransferase
MADDGYIYVRVVDQLLAGHGPVFNQGERVEATTSPLWLGILSVTKLVLPTISAPWIAVLLGMLFSLVGLAFAQWGSNKLWKSERRIMLPLGSVVVVALPPFWEFATSGLETGLAFAWLGACFWSLVRLLPPRDERRGPRQTEFPTSNSKLPAIAPPMWLPVLIGLGVLIRPDFGLFVGAFIFVLFFLCRGKSLIRAAAFHLPSPSPTRSSAWATTRSLSLILHSRRRPRPRTGRAA